MKNKRVKLKRIEVPTKRPHVMKELFEVIETKNVMDPLPGDRIDTVELGHLVNKQTVDVIVVQS